jgi:two-component system, LuxR family, sensor kinase FixL
VIRIDLKPILFRLLRGVPMPVIAILVGLVAGLLVWSVLERIQSEQIGRIFGQELESRLDLRSRESLMRFDQYLAQYAATTRLVAKHRLLAEYLESQLWTRGEDYEPRSYQGWRPPWLPDFLERDGLVPPSHVLLVDGEGELREIYTAGAAPLPSEVAAGVENHLRHDREVRTVFIAFEDRVFLLVSDAVEDRKGFVMGSLVVLIPVDQAFLVASQRGLLASDSAIALVNSDDQRILVSLDPDWLTLDSPLSQWRNAYLITSQSLSGYEGSDLNLLFTTLVSHDSVERMSRHVRIFERRQRGIAALVFIATFTLVIYLVSARLNKVLRRLSGFARRALEIEDPGFSRGANQLILLEDWVQQFTLLVLRAREETSRRHEIAMRESEALKAAVMEASLDSIVTLDRHGRIRELNPTAERTFGYGRDQVLGASFSRLLLAGSARSNFYALLREGRRAQREGREPQTRSELLAQRADGIRVPMEVSVVPIQLEDELFHTLYLHDITKRKERDREIRSLAGFASESPNPMLRLSPSGHLLYANRASEPLLRLWGGAGPPPANWLALARQALADGHQREGEFECEGLVYDSLFVPVSELGYVNIYARDITAVRHAERELRRHQAELVHVCRLSTMGEVATGMAHELNQPLAAIVNYARGCGRRLRQGTGEPEELAQAMDRIGNQAQRAGEIIKRLRGLVGKQAPVRVRVDLNHMVAEVSAFAEFEIAKLGLTIDLDLTVGDIPVLVDLVQIEQVLLNLVRNALDALEEVPPERRRLTIRGRREGHWALAIVEDTGPGISPEVKARLFDPFFTTKLHGMGMGLPISQTILDNHGGEIRVESEPGVGTRFQVRLPLANEAVAV